MLGNSIEFSPWLGLSLFLCFVTLGLFYESLFVGKLKAYFTCESSTEAQFLENK